MEGQNIRPRTQERHDDPVYDAHAERDREDLQREIEHPPVEPGASRAPSIVASHAAKPIVKAGKMI